MTGKERITAILNHQPVDRIGVYEHFWNDTYTVWREKGHIGIDENFDDHFGFDLSCAWALTTMANLDFKREVVAEDEDTITYLDGNGAILRRHKFHDTTPEHVGFKVTDRETWDELIKPFLLPDIRRIKFESYRNSKTHTAEKERFFTFGYAGIFECIHNVCGHENMLAGMILDPEWIIDMAMSYADLLIELMRLLFEKEGIPDGIFVYEDLGYKGSPFMSPTMYREIIQPAQAKVHSFLKTTYNLPIIFHSCGFMAPLLPDLINTGIDCLQALEVKAGMDLVALHEQYGDKIAFMGGIDVRCLYNNDLKEIDDELTAKIPYAMRGFNYALHSDHSIPSNVEYETYKYFIKKGLELGTY